MFQRSPGRGGRTTGALAGVSTWGADGKARGSFALPLAAAGGTPAWRGRRVPSFKLPGGVAWPVPAPGPCIRAQPASASGEGAETPGPPDPVPCPRPGSATSFMLPCRRSKVGRVSFSIIVGGRTYDHNDMQFHCCGSLGEWGPVCGRASRQDSPDSGASPRAAAPLPWGTPALRRVGWGLVPGLPPAGPRVNGAES